jgi:hypothetical protein
MNIEVDISDNKQEQIQQHGEPLTNNEIKINTEDREKIMKKKQDHIKREAIKMVCRQTDYDEQTAKEKMEIANYNYEIVLNEYYGIASKVSNKEINLSTNQMIYGEIRNLMDDGARRFRINQERSEKMNRLQQK